MLHLALEKTSRTATRDSCNIHASYCITLGTELSVGRCDVTRMILVRRGIKIGPEMNCELDLVGSEMN